MKIRATRKGVGSRFVTRGSGAVFSRREAKRAPDPLFTRLPSCASRSEPALVTLAVAHAALLVAAPTAPVIALGVWWNSNTIAHNFIHRPFFRQRSANHLFALCLSVLVGIPQSLWRDRHLAHHAGARPRVRMSHDLVAQSALVLGLWVALAILAPRFFLTVYVPGYIGGLLLCAVHGHYEHARGTTSHYGRLYNFALFNDGYHVEHHANPRLHWTALPETRRADARASTWPAPLRWMELGSLDTLERLVLRSRLLQRFVLRAHARAFRAVIGAAPAIDRVAIVGGGLFPRTALILRTLLPSARITIIDADGANLDLARARLAGAPIEFVHERFDELDTAAYDLLVVPLSFDGRKSAIYARPPAPAVIVHDWIWRKRGVSRIVSAALLKRINLVVRP
jgi:hypothetical protein